MTADAFEGMVDQMPVACALKRFSVSNNRDFHIGGEAISELVAKSQNLEDLGIQRSGLAADAVRGADA